MHVMANPPPMVPQPSHKVRRAALGAMIGSSPGLALMIVNLVAVSGEAVLTVGVGAIFLTVGGAVAGAILGTQGGAPGRTVLGALAGGGLCGVLAFVTPGFTLLAPLAVIAGAVAGGMIAGQPARPAPPPPPPPSTGPSPTA